jgi:mRNA interferase RelE/StbE
LGEPHCWRVEFDEAAADELRKLGGEERRRALAYLRSRIATVEDPRRFGKALTADLRGLWRYRVGDVRIVVRIEDEDVVVLVLRVAQRRDVYR